MSKTKTKQIDGQGKRKELIFDALNVIEKLSTSELCVGFLNNIIERLGWKGLKAQPVPSPAKGWSPPIGPGCW